MSYQYIETLSDKAVKRYQSADFCFPFAETRLRMWRQLTERIELQNLHITLHCQLLTVFRVGVRNEHAA